MIHVNCRHLSLVTAALAFAAVVGCKSTATTAPINVPLAFQPSNTSIATVQFQSSPKVFVAPVIDERPTGAMPGMSAPATTMPAKVVIGQNVQGPAPIDVYDTGASPTSFMHDVVVDQLTRAGAQVVTSPDDASRIVTVTLQNFNVEEAGRFNATVTAMVRVSDKAGKALYDKSDTGTDSTWGHDRDPALYQQELSNASVGLIQSFLNDGLFQKAMTPME